MLPESFINISTNSGVYNYNTRKIYFPHANARTNMVSKTFIHQGPKSWQVLPFYVQNSKKYFMNNC